MSELTEFLLARIAEDEERAVTRWQQWSKEGKPLPAHKVTRRFLQNDDGSLRLDPDPDVRWTVEIEGGKPQEMTQAAYYSMMAAVYGRTWETHTEVKDERLLRECEAKRRIVEEHGPGSYPPYPPDSPSGKTYDCFRCLGSGNGACQTTRILASVYADHPDYRDEWKP